MSVASESWLNLFVAQELLDNKILNQEIVEPGAFGPGGVGPGSVDQTIVDQETTRIIGELTQHGIHPTQFIAQWSEATLAAVEADPDRARRCLLLATAILQQVGQNSSTQAMIDYVQARIYVQAGDLTSAEAALHTSQVHWQDASEEAGKDAGKDAGEARTLVGLTQVLALQGRYAEAEQSIQTAILRLEAESKQQHDTPAANEASLRLYAAQHNLATLLLSQDRHAEALRQYECNQQLLQQMAQNVMGSNVMGSNVMQSSEQLHKIQLDKIRLYQAHLHLNRGVALLLLDQPDAAESAFHQAEGIFEQTGESHQRGNALTNLGALYLRTGRYAEALRAFEQASLHLLGALAVEAVIDLAQLYQAQQLPIDLANTYLALNLLREAEMLLTRCATLFRTAGQPADLAQTLYSAGLVQMRVGNWSASQTLLAEASGLFDSLQNQFWHNRTRVALASLAYQQGETAQAIVQLDALPVWEARNQADQPALAPGDAMTYFDAQLLRVRLALSASNLTAAKQIIHTLLPQVAQQMPHCYVQSQWRLQHLLGQIALKEGDRQTGRVYLLEAIHLLETQRANLPIEEIRLTFLDDKTEVYADLVAALLDTYPVSDSASDTQSNIVSQADMAEAFATVERARSRTLLERLLTALPENTQSENTHSNNTQPQDRQRTERSNEVRRQLHWLYNQLIHAQSSAADEKQTPDQQSLGNQRTQSSRFAGAEVSAELWAQEAMARNLNWQQTHEPPELRAQVQPVDLAAFQQALAADQQAIVYSSIGSELFAFAVDRTGVQLFRNLCSLKQLDEMLAEWRFQFGRAELGYGHILRLGDHLLQRIRGCLHDLYRFLLAPLEKGGAAPHRLVIPHKGLHALPFHALWDGEDYLLTRYQWSYSPSASIAVYLHERNQETQAPQSELCFAGLAINDPSIPAARSEVESAAQRFSHSTLYLDQDANRQGLRDAAASADILHLATHGLFRPDNPFFSVLKLADGWIDVRELYQLPLRAQLVILSACESGVVQARGGDEVIGLARGFLGAGARQLIASLWNVHDASAATLLNRFYEHFLIDKCRIAADALRKAQLDAISTGLHPYFWAPFYTIGG